ncbi:excalibur calcium-binding domain-containing protein [Sandarakinorhabdus oryzae]|uniref:excalibur calcium-binding domain-containing protein n=1 Tax=Sandarakinorhabdus oryzae TaxID=2675220 RepID=UPI0018CC669E|nr:excalibur calcium-binding domain-containing protein [Sandarakinorhabdus oryzae]
MSRRRRRNEELSSVPLPTLAVVGIVVGGGVGWLATTPRVERALPVAAAAAQPVSEVVAALKPEPRPFRRFSGCNEARAAGYENITSDEPSYQPEWDGDQDGIACEPHR